MLPAMLYYILVVKLIPVMAPYESDDRLAKDFVRNTQNADSQPHRVHRGRSRFPSADPLAAALDHVVLAADKIEETFVVFSEKIAGIKTTSPGYLPGRRTLAVSSGRPQ